MPVSKRRPAFKRKITNNTPLPEEPNIVTNTTNSKPKPISNSKGKRKKAKVKPKTTAKTPKSMPPEVEIHGKTGRRRVRLSKAGHVLVNALAGTGKTFTIVEAVNRIMSGPTPGIVGSPEQDLIWAELSRGNRPASVVVLAFNRSIKKEIQKKLPPGATAYTCHGYGHQQLAKAGVNVRNVDNRKTSFIMADLYGCGDVFEFWRENRGYAPVVGNLVSLFKLNLIDTDMDDAAFIKEVWRIADYYGIEVPEKYVDCVATDVFNVLEQSVKRTDIIDYDDMVWLPLALGLAPKKVDMMFVDERQDLNKAQQQMVYNAANRIVMVGDVNQAVYGFAGADADACDNMQRRLEANALGCKVFPLTYTHRCAKAIVAEAQKYVPEIKALPDAEEGIVRYCQESDIKDGKEQFQSGDMVVCRINAPLVSYCLKMISNGVKAKIQGKQIGEDLIGLIKQLKAKTCATLMEAVDDYRIKQTEKLSSQRNSENAIINLNDRCDSIICFAQRHDTIKEVKEAIEEIFSESDDKDVVLLSSIHKAKGLESYRVWFLYPEICPHPMARQPWQKRQEINLRYVGATRAGYELIYVQQEPKG